MMLRLLLSAFTVFLSVLPAWSQRVRAGPNVWVSSGAADLVHVEAVLAVHPRESSRMVTAAIALRRPHAPDWQDYQTIVVYQSEDGGKSWSSRPVTPLPDDWAGGDPWLAWHEQGELFLSAVAGRSLTQSKEPRARARLFLSRDGGRSWTPTRETPFSTNSSEDHPVLALTSSRAAGPVLYLVATHATTAGNGIDAVHVNVPDLKATPAPPLRPTVPQVNLGGAAVRTDGQLVVSFHSMASPMGLWAARLDRARSAWEVVRIRNVILPVGFPSLAVDRSNGTFRDRLYSAWVEGENESALRVVVAWSDDGGLTWSAPVRAHTDISPAVRTLPTIAVAPDGTVGIIWQDRRNASGGECSDLYGTISTNGAATFLPEVRISSETSCPDAEQNGAARHRFRLGGGDYQGLAGVGPRSFQAIWSDSRTGRYQLYTARLDLHQGQSEAQHIHSATGADVPHVRNSATVTHNARATRDPIAVKTPCVTAKLTST
jgi:hypothetical protein